jgi:hypothetical protein
MGGWDPNGSEGDLLGGVEWIQLAQDRDRWRGLVKTVTNLRVLVPRSYLVTPEAFCLPQCETNTIGATANRDAIDMTAL